jgi:hypothetical protein
MIVEILTYNQYGKGAPISCLPSQIASHSVSLGLWIPTSPASHEIIDLAERLEEDNEDDNNSSLGSSRRID